MDKRYQFQPWYVKVYRRVKYFPLFLIYLCFSYLFWILQGFPINKCEGYEELPLRIQQRFFTRWNTFVSIYWINLSIYHMKMKYYYETDEVIGEIKNGSK